MVLSEIEMQFADGTVVCPGKNLLLPSEMVAHTRTGTEKDHRDSVVQDEGRTVGGSDTNKTKSWKRMRYKAGQSFKE